ncbi:MAG: hypothetical protein HFI76_14630 [Lachnospiraceae bacterium]|nr:hypothetical protein [Lachnospiraceae bacterium]
MGSVWKIVLSFVLIVMLTAVGMMITSANADAAAAGDYMEEVSAVIRESNYNQMVIEQCKKEAVENGYDMHVEVYERQAYGQCSYAKIILRYPYRLPVFRAEVWKKKERII